MTETVSPFELLSRKEKLACGLVGAGLIHIFCSGQPAEVLAVIPWALAVKHGTILALQSGWNSLRHAGHDH
jgi:hypothetical protein